MGYIRFVLVMRTSADEDSDKPNEAIIKRMSSDMEGVENYDLNLIMHALSHRGGAFTRGFILDRGRLDSTAWKLG